MGEHDEAIDFADVVAAGRRRPGRGAARADPGAATARGAEIADGAGSCWPTPSSSSALDAAGVLVLGDEVLTPDSSRFWPAAAGRPAPSQPSFDKQYVRDWLTAVRLGPRLAAAGAAGRRRRGHPRALRQGLRAAHRPPVRLTAAPPRSRELVAIAASEAPRDRRISPRPVDGAAGESGSPGSSRRAGAAGPAARATGPPTASRAGPPGITTGSSAIRPVARLPRDTYLPRALARDRGSRLAAVLLGAPPGAVVSHRTAAALWGLQLPLAGRGPRGCDLTVPPGARARARRTGGSTARSSRGATVAAAASLVTSRSGPGSTSRACCSRRRCSRSTDQLLPAELAARSSRQQLRAAAGRGGAHGSARAPAGRRARRVADGVGAALAAPRRRSAGAGAAARRRRRCAAEGGRCDLAWPEQRVVVEFDGDGHRERAVFVEDLRRQNGLVAGRLDGAAVQLGDVLGAPGEVVETIPGTGDRQCDELVVIVAGRPRDRRELGDRRRAPGRLGGVPRVVVDVVLKPEISDPQGQAVLGALGRLGHGGVRSVRQGKHFVLDVEGTPDEPPS